MATITLAEAAKLAQNELVAGVIEHIIDVNQFFEVLPFEGVNGSSLSITREKTLGPVATTGVGEDIGYTGAPIAAQAYSSSGEYAIGDIVSVAAASGTVSPVRYFVNIKAQDGSGTTTTAANQPAGSNGAEFWKEIEVTVEGINKAQRQTAKDPATFENVNFNLTTILGDAHVNGLVQATRSNAGNDQTVAQIGSKAKAAGREFQRMLIEGDGTTVNREGTAPSAGGAFTTNEFPGLNKFIDDAGTGQKIGSTGSETDISASDDAVLEVLDEGIDLVKDKDNTVDYIMLNPKTMRAIKKALRKAGGATMEEFLTLPSGNQVMTYSATPVFKNEFVKAGTSSSIYFGTLDDGSESVGIAGLTSENEAGLQVIPVGTSESRDEQIYRIRWYCGLANFSQLGVARAYISY